MRQSLEVTLIGFLLVVQSVFGLWHAYDANKKYDNCKLNGTEEWKTEFERQTKAIPEEKKQKWKLWPDIVSKRDLAEGETMYGFEEGMEAIWKNQHPEDCSTAKYLISGGFESGFGSEIHVLGSGLALAMRMNRVYIMLATNGDSSLMDKMHSNNKFQVDIDFCRKQGKMNLECYYEPWSSCTLEDALKGTTLQTLRTEGRNIAFNDLKKQQSHEERTLIVHLSPELVDFIPSQFTHLMHCSPFHKEKYRYWWRSLTAAYIMRPNEATRQLIVQHREDPETKFDKETEQCVSVYVRRGDKHLEMRIIEDETLFFESARLLNEKLKTATGQPEKGVMFIGSEDPAVMDSAIAWGKKNSWAVKYSNLFDRRNVTTGLNNDQQQEARKKNAFVHHEWEYFTMVLNIDAHLRCSAFVCTHRSNFCRIIDELRATVGGKANKQYADFTCGNPPPCIDSPETGIDWRRV